MGDAQRLLVIGAHAADFLWRAGGVIAANAAAGGTTLVLSLSYGERGESGELWKEPGQTVENVKRIRHEQAEEAARLLGAEFRCLDLGDYPLDVDSKALTQISDIVRETAPDVILTHTERDPFNPDHPVAHTAAVKARMLASGAGVSSGFKTIKPPRLFLFEPHQPELCGFVPTTFLDITPVIEVKKKAMEVMASQRYLQQYYLELALRRGNHARRVSGRKDVQYAEAFQRVYPEVVTEL